MHGPNVTVKGGLVTLGNTGRRPEPCGLFVDRWDSVLRAEGVTVYTESALACGVRVGFQAQAHLSRCTILRRAAAGSRCWGPDACDEDNREWEEDTSYEAADDGDEDEEEEEEEESGCSGIWVDHMTCKAELVGGPVTGQRPAWGLSPVPLVSVPSVGCAGATWCAQGCGSCGHSWSSPPWMQAMHTHPVPCPLHCPLACSCSCAVSTDPPRHLAGGVRGGWVQPGLPAVLRWCAEGCQEQPVRAGPSGGLQGEYTARHHPAPAAARVPHPRPSGL